MSFLLQQVLTEKNLFVRTLVLNRPRQLNALSSQMVCQELIRVLYFPILSCILHCYVIQPSIALPIYIICSFSVSCCAYRLFAVVLCFACQCNFLEHLVMLTCHCILSICQGHANGCNSLELELGACMKCWVPRIVNKRAF